MPVGTFTARRGFPAVVAVRGLGGAAFAAVIAAVTSLNGTRQLTVSAEPAHPEDLAARVLQGLATLPT